MMQDRWSVCLMDCPGTLIAGATGLGRGRPLEYTRVMAMAVATLHAILRTDTGECGASTPFASRPGCCEEPWCWSLIVVVAFPVSCDLINTLQKHIREERLILAPGLRGSSLLWWGIIVTGV